MATPPRTLKRTIGLYFLETSKGEYVPNSGVTASFVRNCITNLKVEGRLSPDEMRELLKIARREGSGLVINIEGKEPS